jgi:hypothetical protein
MPVIGATNFEQTHTEQISAQLEIMGHLEIHMNETICSGQFHSLNLFWIIKYIQLDISQRRFQLVKSSPSIKLSSCW